MIAGGLHVQLGQRIAVGGFYSRSVMGYARYSHSTDYDLENMSYGIDLRISGRRGARWRPYLGLAYGKAEFVQHMGSLDLAARTDMLGVDAGIMLRFGRNLYWKIVEVSPRYLPDKIWWLDSDLCIEAKTGFLYNIRLKTK